MDLAGRYEIERARADRLRLASLHFNRPLATDPHDPLVGAVPVPGNAASGGLPRERDIRPGPRVAFEHYALDTGRKVWRRDGLGKIGSHDGRRSALLRECRRRDNKHSEAQGHQGKGPRSSWHGSLLEEEFPILNCLLAGIHTRPPPAVKL